MRPKQRGEALPRLDEVVAWALALPRVGVDVQVRRGGGDEDPVDALPVEVQEEDGSGANLHTGTVHSRVGDRLYG